MRLNGMTYGHQNMIMYALSILYVSLGLCASHMNNSKKGSSDFLTRFNAMRHSIVKDTYDPTVFPWDGQNPVLINNSFHLEKIMSVTEKEQILKSLIWNYFTWYDPRLTWNVTEHQGISSIRVPSDVVWKPDVMLQNSAGSSVYINKLDEASHVIVKSSGRVTWAPFHKAETFCALDSSMFPFDTQTCHFWMLSWVYPEHLLQVRKA